MNNSHQINSLRITIATHKPLQEFGINYLEDLEGYTYEELEATGKFRRKALVEIKRLMEEYGLSFKASEQ